MRKIVNQQVLEGSSAIRHWIENYAQPSLTELFEQYKEKLRREIDDDFVEDEYLPLLLRGEMEVTSNGDDAGDERIADVCAEYRTKCSAIREKSVLVLASSEDAMTRLTASLTSLHPDIVRYWTCMESRDHRHIEQTILSSLQQRHDGNFVVVTEYEAKSTINPVLTELAARAECKSLLLVFVQFHKTEKNIQRAIVLGQGAARHAQPQDSESEETTEYKALLMQLGSQIRRSADSFEDFPKVSVSPPANFISRLSNLW